MQFIALLAFSFYTNFHNNAHAQLPTPESTLASEKNYIAATLKKFYFTMRADELSGLYRQSKTKLLAVVDSKDPPSILEVIQKKNTVQTEVLFDLSLFTGYSKYIADAQKLPTAKVDKFREFDLEGISGCGSKLYVANERVRQIIEVDTQKKTIRALPVDFSVNAEEISQGGINAGFEGIAADCKHKILYLAKEREPRKIYAIDLISNTVKDQFEIALSSHAKNIINTYNSTKPKLEIAADFSDLAFDGGYLYALERGTYEITKIDPKTRQVTARFYFGNLQLKRGSQSVPLKTLYDTREPFGLAEGLSFDKHSMRIALDNNKNALSEVAQKKLSPPMVNSSIIVVMERPSGF